MNYMIPDSILDRLFRNARTHNAWTDAPVSDDELHRLYELMKWAPTSANSSPARIIFLRSAAAKARLKPHLSGGNVEKSMAAPVTAIIGYDTEFYRHLPRLFAHSSVMHTLFSDPQNSARTERAAFQNSSLQGGYFILAARCIGLDCGPMSGFDAAGVDREFWSGTTVKTNFLCNLGHGDSSGLFARLPRLDFDEVCRIV
ncbi:malonic semialdehyde reductase [Pusillimonas sp.]|uniref:malonic semialdehyde reductase n=1 Tax=Pusillimonas sp. TaxID=3040095 RepID=UPI0037C8DFE2